MDRVAEIRRAKRGDLALGTEFVQTRVVQRRRQAGRWFAERFKTQVHGGGGLGEVG